MASSKDPVGSSRGHLYLSNTVRFQSDEQIRELAEELKRTDETPEEAKEFFDELRRRLVDNGRLQLTEEELGELLCRFILRTDYLNRFAPRPRPRQTIRTDYL